PHRLRIGEGTAWGDPCRGLPARSTLAFSSWFLDSNAERLCRGVVEPAELPGSPRGAPTIASASSGAQFRELCCGHVHQHLSGACSDVQTRGGTSSCPSP